MRDVKSSFGRSLRAAALGWLSLFFGVAQGAVPGITAAPGPNSTSTFNLSASAGYITQPDGASIYSWGYGCVAATATFAPAAIPNGVCSKMQLPGPTLIVRQGDTVTVRLTNNLPAAAGNTSIVFPGFRVTTTSRLAMPGVLAQEARHGATVDYSFVADTPGTHAYYSGTQSDLQVEMGLYGALVVLPNLPNGLPTDYKAPTADSRLPNTCFALGNKLASLDSSPDFRLAAAAYDHPSACYDREYLFQFSELDPAIHAQALEQVQADQAKASPCTQPTGCMLVQTEPYHPAYYLINGRSFPDLADPNYAAQYPRQPYNGNPHMHPGELVLVRIIGQGHAPHPLHEHANHLRVLARDGHMLLTASNRLAGPLLFTTTATPGPDAGRDLPVHGQEPELGRLRAHLGYARRQCRRRAAVPSASPMRTATSRPAAARPAWNPTTTNGAPTTRSRSRTSRSARSAAAARSPCRTRRS